MQSPKAIAAKISQLVAATMLLGLSLQAAAVTYEIDFTRSTYQVMQGDSFSDLLNAHEAGTTLSSQTIGGLNGIDTQAQITGDARDHSIRMSTSFSVVGATQYEFQVGADWGRGGGIAIYNDDTNSLVSEQIFSHDIWWGKSWSNSDVISTDFEFSPGNWTVMWIGFEGCCSGSTSVRFAENGGSFNALTTEYFHPVPLPQAQTVSAIPLPGTALLFASALGLLVTARRRS